MKKPNSKFTRKLPKADDQAISDTTHNEYMKNAEHLVKKAKQKGITIDHKTSKSDLTKFLNTLAETHTTQTFNKYRRALSYWVKIVFPSRQTPIHANNSENDYSGNELFIAQFKNPLPENKRKKGKKYCKKVTSEDAKKLIETIKKTSSSKTKEVDIAAIKIAMAMPIRPTELGDLSYIDDDKGLLVTSIGAKKRDSDDRGIDRTLFFQINGTESKNFTGELKRAIKTISSHIPSFHSEDHDKTVKRLEDRIWALSARAFPRRKTENRPTLYSFRHTWGSYLKANRKDKGGRTIIAALMGHRSQGSATAYGNRRSGTKGTFGPFKTHAPTPVEETVQLVNQKPHRFHPKDPNPDNPRGRKSNPRQGGRINHSSLGF